MPVARLVARRIGAVDEPGELSIHTRPVARTGGLAILLAFMIAMGYALWRGDLGVEATPALWGLLGGAVIAAAGGLYDDARDISARQKLLWQFAAATGALAFGIRSGFLSTPGLALVLTLAFLIGGANAMNLLDGMNGLAGGVSVIAAISLAVLGVIQGNRVVAVMGTALAGAVLGFVPYNLPRASAFMGDVGSLFLGFTLASLAVLLGDAPLDASRFVLPIAVLGLLVLDTGLALTRRALGRGHVFTGDRDHTYDILARRLGGRTGSAVVGMWALALILGATGVGAAYVGGWLGAAIVALGASVVAAAAWASGMFAPLTRPSGTVAADERARTPGRTRLRRSGRLLLWDLVTVIGAFYTGLLLRLSGDVPGDGGRLSGYLASLSAHLPIIVVSFVLCAFIFRLYRRIWRYASIQEVTDILLAGGLATGAILFIDIARGGPHPIPIGAVIVGGILATGGFIVVRYRQRLLTGVLWRIGVNVDTSGERTLIVGAGEVGQLLAWRMHHLQRRWLPVGFVDDKPDKLGLRVHGIEVLGAVWELPRLVREHRADLVVIAIHNLTRQRLNEIVDTAQRTDARVQILPDVMGLLDGTTGAPALRDVTIEDLLGRPTRQVDEPACRALIEGKRVLVTGAAGSIGSELCRQVARYNPSQLLAVDQDETGLFDLAQSFGERASSPALPLVTLIGDVSSEPRMGAIWKRYRPEIVFHCAAYKHVPMLEDCPTEAVRSNVLGTLVPARFSHLWGAERFILVSTDKAACPVNIMGASKRVAELIVLALQDDANGTWAAPGFPDTPSDVAGGVTRFALVRFGNVLGSRGSVVPIFERQIDGGGPVTITDSRMVRHFMSISEAVSLVIQAGAYTQGGDLFVLDMGREVHIEDLARRMVRLRGLRVGEDIAFEYIGARPGEKLSEVLFCPTLEEPRPTRHSAIMRAENHHALPRERLLSNVGQMIRAAGGGDSADLSALVFDTARLLCPQTCRAYEEALIAG